MLQEVAEDDEGIFAIRVVFDADGRGETDRDSDRDLRSGRRIWTAVWIHMKQCVGVFVTVATSGVTERTV